MVKVEETGETSQIRTPGSRVFGGDRVMWIILAIMAAISLMVVYSSSGVRIGRDGDPDTMYHLVLQCKYILFGFVAVWIVHRFNYQTYGKFARLLFLLSLGLMVITLIFGQEESESVRRVTLFGYTLQASDFVRVTLVVVLAKELSRRQAVINKTQLLPVVPIFKGKLSEKQKMQNLKIWSETTRPLLVPVVLACGLIFAENFSTSALIFLTCLVMLYIGRVRIFEIWRLTRIVLVVVIIAIPIMSHFNIGRARTWESRIASFTSWDRDQPDAQTAEGGGIFQEELTASQWQARQARIAIATGGISGKGPGQSTFRELLPRSDADYAFAFVVEEYGFIGALVVVALFLWIFFRAIVIFQKCERAFPSLLVLGLGTMIALQAIINMLVSVDLAPVTGQTLPIIGRGGSSLLFTSVALGMILGVSRQMQENTMGTVKEDGVK